jgi:acetyl-CoA/propionyl-CoA carboxylase biotin carboxyl carrier protein
VLIANRGEIAVRIIRTLREMGLTSIAAFSEADKAALFVLEADEAYALGPAAPSESYLNAEAILAVARRAKAQAIHPGYGFLAENAEFAASVGEAGLTFIGPSPDAIHLMGDKVRARQAVAAAGVPIVPGTTEPLRNLDQADDFASQAGYPLIVKAAGGGGGRGMRRVDEPAGLARALESAQREARSHFKNPDIYLERYFPNPHHVEIQVLGDSHGHLVHLGERDCSIQRRHQKLIEETPSPVLDASLRQRMGEMALRAASSASYVSAGTVEFLVTAEREFYFLEMNTRIQVEHPITEQVTGVDLIREMVLAARGEHLTVRESARDLCGHAIEVRVNAEDPVAGFRPTPVRLTRYREPGGIGIRVDSGVYQGYAIPEHYDSLMAKLIAWAPDREAARRRALRALGEYDIVGPASTLSFAAAVLEHPDFVRGEAGTNFVADHFDQLQPHVREPRSWGMDAGDSHRRGPERTFEVEVNRRLFRVRVAELQTDLQPASNSKRPRAVHPRQRSVGGALVSPMHGTIIGITKQPGEAIAEGETLVIIEAMKMENEIASQRSGTVTSVDVQIGDTVDADQRLAVVE